MMHLWRSVFCGLVTFGLLLMHNGVGVGYGMFFAGLYFLTTDWKDGDGA